MRTLFCLLLVSGCASQLQQQPMGTMGYDLNGDPYPSVRTNQCTCQAGTVVTDPSYTGDPLSWSVTPGPGATLPACPPESCNQHVGQVGDPLSI